MENIKITKSLRFKLESSNQNNLINNITENLNTTKEFDLVNFANSLYNYTEHLYKFLYYTDKNNENKIKENIVLQKTWLKLYAKREFASCKDEKSLTIKTCKLSEKIETYFNNLNIVCTTLLEYSIKKKHEQTEKRAIAILLNKLNTKSYLAFFVDLVKSAKNKNEKDDLSIKLKSDGKKLLNQLSKGIEYFLPEQSAGMCIAKASFNYHAIDKNSVDFDKEIENTEKKLETSLECLSKNFKDNKKLGQNICNDVKCKSNDLKLYLGDSPFMEFDTYASLRQILKNIKATQKSKFNEAMQRGDSYRELKESDLYLFNNISQDEYKEYFDYTMEIEKLATERNQTFNEKKKKELATKLEKTAQKRGKLLQKFGNYRTFAEFYRQISETHGTQKAKLLAIEKEKVESQLLGYWAVIMENEGKHHLVLIPRGEKAKALKEAVEKANNSTTNTKLYWFESLTYRSLQKLCFGNPLTNTFAPNIKDLFIQENIQGEFSFKDKKEAIDFYKKVLRHNYTQKVLKFPYHDVENRVLNENYSELDDFKIALEQVCYKRYVNIDKSLIDNLASKFDAQIFEITSLDLRREENTKDKTEKYAYKEKRPTVLWREFWKEENEENGFDIRLNPEISIIYRKAKESRIKKYGADSKKNNRYLHDQFTLVMTFSEHCNAPERNLAFANINDEQRVIEEFNNKFKKEKICFALGIDNGITELSTLGVYFPEFEKESIEEKLAELQNVEKYGFDTLTIRDLKYKEKDYNGKDREIIKNVSYFLKEDLYCRTFGKTSQEYKAMFEKVFEKKRLLSLDLSAAKLVCGHIVTNGDVKALYNLWLKHAQRNIYDMNDHSKIEGAKKVEFKHSEELDSEERRIFIAYLNNGNERYEKLSDKEKNAYIEWLYRKWASNETRNEKFEKVYKEQKIKGDYLHNVLLGATYIGEAKVEHIRHVFKFREDFEQIFTREEIEKEIDNYNIRTISDEVLDLNLNHAKSSVVANVIGIIDFLYKDYKNRFGGEGIVVKEGFGISKVEGDRMKFSGNIYRMLERKLYQKFQNYGLVPPVKNITEFRGKDNAFVEFGNICFIDYSGTSQRCPVCGKGKLNHTETCSENCGFKSEGIMHSNDGIAGFNIAKKGFIEVTKK